MRIDLHNHTPLCNHATGTPADYLGRAVELGVDVYGFSDHAPMNFDPQYRMTMAQRVDYRAAVADAARQYDGRIETLFAYEVDYLPGYVEDDILHEPCDYLIGSVHFLDEWGFDNPEYLAAYKDKDPDTTWQGYFDLVAQMAKSGDYQIVGHLDLLKVFNFRPHGDIRLLARDAFRAIKRAGMAIEINPAGLRKPVGEQYPSLPLLELAFEDDIPITFGSDAHSVAQVGFRYDEMAALAKSIGYTRCALFREKTIEMVNF